MTSVQPRKKRWIFIAIPIILLIAYFSWERANEKSIADLPGQFEEVAQVRNEQNKGGIIRVYAVTVGDRNQANFDACADFFPTNDYGSLTTVYFFDKNEPFPTSLSLDTPHYDATQYQAISIVKRFGSKND